jgi:exonuclease SbcD
LNEQKSILKKLNIYVIGGFENPKDSTVPIYSKDGELKGVVSGVPFLRESDFRDTLSSSDESSRGKELENSIKNHYQEMFMEAKKVANSKVPLVATGHLTVLNTQMFESMRELYIGSLKTFNIELFPEFDYIALGHFHKIKRVKNVCYSGSPIPLSFDEANGDKYLLDVEVLPDRDLKIREVVVPKFRELLNFSGDFETIKEKIKSFKVNSKNLPAWAKIDIKKSQDNITFSEAIKELKSLNRDIKILKSSIVDSNLNIGLNRLEESAIKLQKMTPKSVFEKRLTLEKEISNKKKDELMSAFLKIVEELESEDFRG